MNRTIPDDLDPEIAELLQCAELYPQAPEDAAARVRQRVMLGLTTTVAPRRLDAHEGPGEIARTALSGAQRWWTTRPGWILLTTFMAGGAAGATLHATLGTPRDRVVFVENGKSSAEKSTSASAPSPPATASGEAPFTLVPHVASAASAIPSADGKAVSTSDLGAEQALLDAARTALAHGLAADALSPLEAHARRFPRGLLAEEREALAVNVLATLGRNDDARYRGTRFLQRYPGSFLRSSVEAALGAIP